MGVMAILQQGQGLIGITFVLLLAWGLSENRAARPSWRWLFGALFLQIAIALAVTRVPFIWTLVGYVNTAVSSIEKATLVGSSYMFGYTGGAPIPFMLKPGVEPPVIVAFQILPLIIVFSAISALLWHWGVLRAAVKGLSWALQKTMGVSGVVGLGAGTTMFLGVVESPLVLRERLVDRLIERQVYVEEQINRLAQMAFRNRSFDHSQLSLEPFTMWVCAQIWKTAGNKKHFCHYLVIFPSYQPMHLVNLGIKYLKPGKLNYEPYKSFNRRTRIGIFNPRRHSSDG